MLSLGLNKKYIVGIKANTIRKNSWMIELRIEELERSLAENDSYKKEERSADDTDSNLGEEVGDILTALEEAEEIGNLDEEQVAIIEEIAEVLVR